MSRYAISELEAKVGQLILLFGCALLDVAVLISTSVDRGSHRLEQERCELQIDPILY